MSSALKIICKGSFCYENETKMKAVCCHKLNNENNIKLSEFDLEMREYVLSASSIFMRSSMMS